MSHVVSIADSKTGEAIVVASVFPDDVEAELWYWEEGNGDCDCNRELAFRRAKGEDVDESEVQCKPDPNHRFAVKIYVVKSSSVSTLVFDSTR